jgi:molybdopterin/thiamine biosynthesis adenylyltransferase
MASRPNWTARITGRVNLPLLADRLVAVVGVGTVGSQVSRELARAGVVRQLLIDYDSLKPENFPRHALGEDYELMNKAEAMAVYLKKELGQTEHRVAPLLIRDDLVSDSELNELFTGVDLVVAATGHPQTQRRLASLALRTWGIPALFPAITGPFDGEVFVQLDRDFPCFHCWHAFRGENAGADAVTALNIDAALGIAGLTTSLALGLLNESADTDLLTPEPQGFQPQLFVQNRRAFAAKRVKRRRNCPSCGGGPPSPGAPESPFAPAPPAGGSVTSPLPRWPTPPSWPAPSRALPRPSAPRAPTADQSRSRNLKIVLGALACLIFSVLVLAESGGGSHPTKAEERQEQADTQALERTAADTRIASLTFKCIEQPVCQTDFPNNPLPLFIGGLDQPLVSYLKHHGYQEQWSDNAGFLHAGWNTGGESSYVAFETEGEGNQNSSDAIPLGTGYIFEPLAEPADGPGPVPSDVPKIGRWVITWQLKGPRGRTLKTLHYSVRVVGDCGISAESYCGKVSRQRSEGSDRGTTAGAEGGYSTAVYSPPSLFPYSE